VANGVEEMVSTNGIAWVTIEGPAGTWTGLTYGEGRFVAVSSRGEIATSTDARHWIETWHHSNYDLTSVTYGRGEFVAGDAALGALVISTTGLVWSRHLLAQAGLKWGSVVYGNGNFVALDSSGSGIFATSVFGYVWTLHSFSPAESIDDATFGCGNFVAVGLSTSATDNFLSSSTGSLWTGEGVPIDATSEWTAVAYGMHRFVAVDNTGNIAWSNSASDCAAAIPTAPLQVSGNIRNGEVWTYMHPSSSPGGGPVNGYRVTISNGSFTKQCLAAVYYQPNCIIRGLSDHEVYWVTAQAHNRFGFSVMTDPEFVIPVTSWSLSAVTTSQVVSRSTPVVVQVTGVLANSQGIYPTSTVTVHFGSRLTYCRPNPFGECLITVPNPPIGPATIYATYTGYGRSYRSPNDLVTVSP
jgi:hypothetical protein